MHGDRPEPVDDHDPTGYYERKLRKHTADLDLLAKVIVIFFFAVVIGALVSCASEPIAPVESEQTGFPLPPNEYKFFPQNIAGQGEPPQYIVQWWSCYDTTGVVVPPGEDPRFWFYDSAQEYRGFTCASGTQPDLVEEDGWICYVEDSDVQTALPPTC